MIINKPLYSLQIYSGVMCTFAFVNFLKFLGGMVSMMKIHILILGIFFCISFNVKLYYRNEKWKLTKYVLGANKKSRKMKIIFLSLNLILEK